MAPTTQPPADRATTPAGKPSLLPLIAGVLLLTAIGVGAGALFGILVGKPDSPAAASKAEAAAAPGATPRPADTGNLKSLPPIVTNLAGAERTWIRLEASILMDGDAKEDFSVLTAKITEDFLAFLRTVSLSQIESGSGFQYLREDLKDRARVRSSKVRDLIVLTFVVE